MPQNPQRLVVVGHGAAGLAAALSAAEQARGRGLPIEITLLEKSREDEAGGNTRWSPSNMRLDAPDRIDPGFADDMHKASGGRADRRYFRTLADNATATIGWLQGHGVEFVTPVYYLSAGPARIQPVGGGGAIVAKLLEAAKRAGVKVSLRMPGEPADDGGGSSRWRRRAPLQATAPRQRSTADAVVLATGGFQGNPEMMRAHFGPGAETLRADLSGDALRYRRRHTHGDRAGRERFRRLERHAHRADRSPQPRIPRRSCWCTLTASSSIRTDAASLTKAVASCTRPGKRSPATSILRDRSGLPMRSSTPGCSTSKALSARSGRRCRRIGPTLSKRLRRRSGFPPAI